MIDNVNPSIYLTIDCEFTEEGFVRELALLLFKDHQIVRALEVLISPSGDAEFVYHQHQINYHLANASHLTTAINCFLTSCSVYSTLSNIKLVGMSLEHDMKSILNTTKEKSMLYKIPQKTQLEMCGRGTLENKAKNHALTTLQIGRILEKLVSPSQLKNYKYHTALYDAIVTGYVYLRVIGFRGLMGVHTRFKKCQHTNFPSYHKDLSDLSLSKKELAKAKALVTKNSTPNSITPTRIPKNFPEIRYKVQKNISNVFDIVAREMFYRQIRRLYFEPSHKKIDFYKQSIIAKVHPVKQRITSYDTNTHLTDPYNLSLVEAGIYLVEEKITIEQFIDFSIYMQQYNLPKTKGTYYKVSNTKRELFVRCLSQETAKKLLFKSPYCTIDQFLRKKSPECSVEIIE
ncbi:MAG: hypothetical protein ACRCSG_06730 [Cellulosilyticaceae bacterium]